MQFHVGGTSQLLSTLTTIMIEMDLINIQPKALESFINILYAIVSQVNCSFDRILRQAVRIPNAMFQPSAAL